MPDLHLVPIDNSNQSFNRGLKKVSLLGILLLALNGPWFGFLF